MLNLQIAYNTNHAGLGHLCLNSQQYSDDSNQTEHPQMQCRVQPCTCSPQADQQSHKKTAQQRPPFASFASLRYAFIALRR